MSRGVVPVRHGAGVLADTRGGLASTLPSFNSVHGSLGELFHGLLELTGGPNECQSLTGANAISSV